VLESRAWDGHRNTPKTGDIYAGTAARFFFNGDFMHERLEAADQIGYFAKVSPAEREAGLDPLQVALASLLYDDMEAHTNTEYEQAAQHTHHAEAHQPSDLACKTAFAASGVRPAPPARTVRWCRLRNGRGHLGGLGSC
jgi:hypothetical protein